jgi:hypothetical protein
VRLTQNKEAERIVVFGFSRIRLSDAERRGDDESEASVEKTKRRQDGVCVCVAEDEFPVGGDDLCNCSMSVRRIESKAMLEPESYHADTCNAEEITNEGIRYADTPETHQGKAEGREGCGEGADGERGLGKVSDVRHEG